MPWFWRRDCGCRRVENLLPDYLHGQLAREPAAIVARHLADCPVCRERLTRLAETLRVLNETAPVPPAIEPELVLAGVRRHLDLASKNRQPGWQRYRRFVLTAAATAVVLIVAGITGLRKWSGRTADDIALVTALVPSEEDALELLGLSDSLKQSELAAIEVLDSALTADAELDDLLEELTPGQQTLLIRELERLFGRKKTDG